MMGYKKCLILIISLVSYFAFTTNVDASLCDKEHLSQLKELANQVEVSYEYIDYSDNVVNDDGEIYDNIDIYDNSEEFVVNSYLVSVNLISDELYIVDEYNNKYYYEQSENGMLKLTVNSGVVEFTIHSWRCADYKLKTVKLDLPKFNVYSYRSECKELEEYEIDVCNPWYQGTITDSSFSKTIDEYLNPIVEDVIIWDKILNCLKNYYLYIIGGIFVVILLVIAIIVHRKRSVLE